MKLNPRKTYDVALYNDKKQSLNLATDMSSVHSIDDIISTFYCMCDNRNNLATFYMAKYLSIYDRYEKQFEYYQIIGTIKPKYNTYKKIQYENSNI